MYTLRQSIKAAGAVTGLNLNLLFYAKSWQHNGSIDGEKQNKKLPPVGIEPRTS